MTQAGQQRAILLAAVAAVTAVIVYVAQLGFVHGSWTTPAAKPYDLLVRGFQAGQLQPECHAARINLARVRAAADEQHKPAAERDGP